MAGEKPSPEEGSKKPKESEEREQPRDPRPCAGHIPIECDVVNMSLSDDLFLLLHNLLLLHKKKHRGDRREPQSGEPGSGGPIAGGIGGNSFRVKSKPCGQWNAADQLTVNIVYTYSPNRPGSNLSDFIVNSDTLPQDYTFTAENQTYAFDFTTTNPGPPHGPFIITIQAYTANGDSAGDPGQVVLF